MKALNKDTLMEIRSSFTRLLSMILMIMVGVAIFFGLQETGPAMVETMEQKIQNENYPDLKVKTTYNLRYRDVEEIEKKTGKSVLEYGYTVDLLAEKTDQAIRLQNEMENLSYTHITEGRLPENTNEILLDEDLKGDYGIGKEITFQGDEEASLKNYKFTVVGYGTHLDYFDTENKGSTTIGDGELKGFGIITKDNFTSDRYSFASMTLENLTGLKRNSPEYRDKMEAHKEEMENLLASRADEEQGALITEIKDGIEEGQEEIRKGRRDLEEGQKKLEDAQKEIDDNRSLVEENKEQILNLGMALPPDITASENALDEAQKELDEEKEIFEKEKADAEKKIADAIEEIQDAREQRNLIIKPIYEISSPLDHRGIEEYFTQGSSLQSISNIFPVFFFLIAMLVSLTTMTRMIDEQRIQIGTLKALGYTNGQISKKYLLYGATSSVIGTILGVAFGHYIVSPMIYNAYNVGNTLDGVYNPLRWDLVFFSFIIALICTAGVAAFALRKSLKENAAKLLRGKAPKGGNRILLERITPLWKKLSFLQKVTMRNIFRYKLRMFMTIIGVAGCAGLMFLGFGIRKSIENTMHNQFQEIIHYDFISVYNTNYPENEIESYRNLLENQEDVAETKAIYYDNLKGKQEGKTNHEFTVIAFEDGANLDHFISLQKRKGDPLSLPEKGILLSEKAADLYGVEPGDTLTLYDRYDQPVELQVSDVFEYYLGHQIYASIGYLNEVYNEPVEVNGDMALSPGLSVEDKEILLQELLAEDAVVTNINTSNLESLTTDLLDSIDIVVYVIIFGASLLAFVVLYNLTNINVSERMRELSTIKVLGFYDNEVTAYVYRETILLTLIGILAGFGVGNAMLQMVLALLMGDNMMLDPSLHWTSFAASAGITLIFTFIVMLIVHRMLKKIDMVEALKAVE